MTGRLTFSPIHEHSFLSCVVFRYRFVCMYFIRSTMTAFESTSSFSYTLSRTLAPFLFCAFISGSLNTLTISVNYELRISFNVFSIDGKADGKAFVHNFRNRFFMNRTTSKCATKSVAEYSSKYYLTKTECTLYAIEPCAKRSMVE